MPRTSFIDAVSDWLSSAQYNHNKWPDQVQFEIPTDLGRASVMVRTAGDFTVCIIGIEQQVPADQIARVMELVNAMNMEFGPGSFTVDPKQAQICCRTAVPFGLIQPDEAIAKLIVGSTMGGLAGAVPAVRDVLGGTPVAAAMEQWRRRPTPSQFTLPEP